MLGPQPLAQRVAADERLELPGEVVVAAERELGVDPVLEADPGPLLQVRGLRAGERLGELGQRHAAPQLQRRAQPRRRRRRVAGVQRGPAGVAQALEAHQVDGLRVDLQRVARRVRAQDPVRQRLAELRDVDVDHLHRGVRDVLAPQVVHEPVDGHRPVGLQQQPGEQRPRLAPAEAQRLLAVQHLQWPQDPELHVSLMWTLPEVAGRLPGGYRPLTPSGSTTPVTLQLRTRLMTAFADLSAHGVYTLGDVAARPERAHSLLRAGLAERHPTGLRSYVFWMRGAPGDLHCSGREAVDAVVAAARRAGLPVLTPRTGNIVRIPG